MFTKLKIHHRIFIKNNNDDGDDDTKILMIRISYDNSMKNYIDPGGRNPLSGFPLAFLRTQPWRASKDDLSSRN